MIEERFKFILGFISYVMDRFSDNRCLSIAAELTVTSLLALVPLTAVVFALLALIPSFQALGEQFQTLLFDYFVPSTGAVVKTYINEFVAKAKDLSSIGFIMLIVTALLLMRTIDSSFNEIWRVKSNQSAVRTLLVYWAVLTLGPLLLGSSLLLTSYLKSLPLISDVVSGNSWLLTFWLPFVMVGLAFSVMYYVIPNCKIPVSHALVAGVITGILFELAKFCFGVFVSKFSTYQLLFGALAAIPLFLIWIYISWGIILLGAEICHGLNAFALQGVFEQSHKFLGMVKIITFLNQLQQTGKTLDAISCQSNQPENRQFLRCDWLDKLVDAGVVARTEEQSFCLLKAPEKINYRTIFEACGQTLPSQLQIEQSELPVQTKQGLEKLVLSVNESLNDYLVI